MYKANEVAAHFDVTQQTVYRWTDDMKEFMSPSAHPDTKDKEYIYTDKDLSVFTELSRMRHQGGSTDTIINSIRSMILSDKLPAFEGLSPPNKLTLNQEQHSELGSRIQSILQERDSYRDKLIEAEKQIAVLESKVGESDALRKQVNELHRELGKLEAIIEMLKEDKKD